MEYRLESPDDGDSRGLVSVAESSPCGLRYRSCTRKIACRIEEVHKHCDGGATLKLTGIPPQFVDVGAAYVREYHPEPGGHYVIFITGQESYYISEMFY